MPDPSLESSMYQTSVPVFVRTLTNLKNILQKAAKHAETGNIEPTDLLNARLAADMYTLTRQIQSAGDIAKACVARLAGGEPTAYEDTEATFPELISRVEKTIAYIRTFTPEQIYGSEERTATLLSPGGAIPFKGHQYLLYYALPNFFFHAVTAYAILRHKGVAIGKMDYLGRP